MKGKNNIKLLLIVLFVIAAFFSTYKLIHLPDDMQMVSGGIGLKELQDIKPVLTLLTISIGAAFVFAILAIYSSGRSSTVNSNLLANKADNVQRDEHEVYENDDTLKAKSKENQAFVTSLSKKIAAFKGDERLETSLTMICDYLQAGQGALYKKVKSDDAITMQFSKGYAFTIPDGETISYTVGEGLVGQASKQGSTMYVDDVPEGYIKIFSGLGSATPGYLLLCPAGFNAGASNLVIEIASFNPFSQEDIHMVEDVAKIMLEKPKTAQAKKSTKEAEAKKEIEKTEKKK